MGIPADPDGDGPGRAGRFFTQTCPKCGRSERCAMCQAEACEERFVPQPGYSTTRCPLHDPQLNKPEVPASYRAYKLRKAKECARCGEQLLD